MKRFTAIIAMMALLFQGVSTLAFAVVPTEAPSVVQEEAPQVEEAQYAKRGMMRHHMSGGNERKQMRMHMRNGQGKHMMGDHGSRMHKMREMHQQLPQPAKEKCAISISVCPLCLLKSDIILEKMVFSQDYVMHMDQQPMQEYYVPLEKPPKFTFMDI